VGAQSVVGAVVNTKLSPYWIAVYATRATARPWFGDYDTRAEADAAAKDALGGCVVGEGMVYIYNTDPRTTDADPVEILMA